MKYAILLLVGVLAMTLNAQNLLNGPEGLTWDSAHQRYLTANYSDNNVIAIDFQGNQSVFVQGTNQPLGVLAYDGVLYVTGNNPPTLYAFDLETAENLFSVGIDNCLALAELCTDEIGFLYIADQGGKVHRFNLDTQESEIWLESGLPGSPQGVVFDRENQRVVVAGYGSSSPIKAYSIEDQTATTLISSTPGQFIQMNMTANGKIYLCSWNGNRVFWFQPGVVDELQVLSQAVTRPSGIYANVSTNMIAVMSFESSQIYYFPLSFESGENTAPVLEQRLRVSPNPFNPETRIYYQIEQSGNAELAIYNARGQRVQILVDRHHDAGEHDVVWDGRDSLGNKVASGVYMAVLRSAGKESNQKMLLMK